MTISSLTSANSDPQTSKGSNMGKKCQSISPLLRCNEGIGQKHHSWRELEMRRSSNFHNRESGGKMMELNQNIGTEIMGTDYISAFLHAGLDNVK